MIETYSQLVELRSIQTMYVCNSAILRCGCTSGEIHPLRCHTPEFVNPESFPPSSELNVIIPKFFNDHDGKVFHGVSTSIKVLSHFRFLCFHVSDITSVAIEADGRAFFVEPTYCLWHFLHSVR